MRTSMSDELHKNVANHAKHALCQGTRAAGRAARAVDRAAGAPFPAALVAAHAARAAS